MILADAKGFIIQGRNFYQKIKKFLVKDCKNFPELLKKIQKNNDNLSKMTYYGDVPLNLMEIINIWDEISTFKNNNKEISFE